MATGNQIMTNRFSPGDELHIGAICPLNGVMSTDAKTIIVSIPTAKNPRFFPSRLTQLTGYVAGVNGLIDPTAHPTYNSDWLTASYGYVLIVKSDNMLMMELTKTDGTAFDNALSNSPIAFCGNVTIVFESSNP